MDIDQMNLQAADADSAQEREYGLIQMQTDRAAEQAEGAGKFPIGFLDQFQFLAGENRIPLATIGRNSQRTEFDPGDAILMDFRVSQMPGEPGGHLAAGIDLLQENQVRGEVPDLGKEGLEACRAGRCGFISAESGGSPVVETGPDIHGQDAKRLSGMKGNGRI